MTLCLVIWSCFTTKKLNVEEEKSKKDIEAEEPFPMMPGGKDDEMNVSFTKNGSKAEFVNIEMPEKIEIKENPPSDDEKQRKKPKKQPKVAALKPGSAANSSGRGRSPA